jgi:hypothetical protein
MYIPFSKVPRATGGDQRQALLEDTPLPIEDIVMRGQAQHLRYNDGAQEHEMHYHLHPPPVSNIPAQHLPPL